MEAMQEWKKHVLEWSDDDADHIQAGEALALLLSGDADAEDTARSITMIYEPSLKRNNGRAFRDSYNKVYHFWRIHMVGAIKRFGDPVVQERLIELLTEISKQPDVITPDGSVKENGSGQAFWRDLPDWDVSLCRENFYYSDVEQCTPEDLEYYLKQGSHLLNVTRFAATLLDRAMLTNTLPIRASDALKLGIEHDYDEKNIDNTKPYEAQVALPVAATWLLVVGFSIYSHCSRNEIEQLKPNGAICEGWAGVTWTLQRWEHWKEQLKKFAERKDFNGQCQAIALQTVGKMAEIEAGHDH